MGTGLTSLGKLGRTPSALMEQALDSALSSAGLQLTDLDGLIALPSLSAPRFMAAHDFAQCVGLLPRQSERAVTVRTIDTGGAGPVSALLAATRMVQHEGCQAVAVVAGDAVASLDTADFLRRAEGSLNEVGSEARLASPVIPHGYSRAAEYQMASGHVTREQLAMCSVLMSRQAARHPLALTQQPLSLSRVLGAPAVAPHIGLLECARRADGGAALIVASSEFMDDGVAVLGGGEASGPLCPPKTIDESVFSCELAARAAYAEASLSPSDIDWWGLYDCFPICFVRAVEACGLASRGRGGAWVEAMHEATRDGGYSPSAFPVNTHGGLMAFGAPWEVPAMYNIIEACEQLNRTAGPTRQVGAPERALVYGNGGIFSHSAVAILGTASACGVERRTPPIKQEILSDDKAR